MERGRKKRKGGRQRVLSSLVFNLVSAKDSPRNREQGCQLGDMTPWGQLAAHTDPRAQHVEKYQLFKEKGLLFCSL